MKLTTNDFDYTNNYSTCNYSSPELTAEYRGYTIRAVADGDSMCPFTDWCSEPPLLALYDGTPQEYGLDLSVPELTRAEIKENLSTILEWIEYPSLLAYAHEELIHYDWDYLSETQYIRYWSGIVDAINESISDYIAGEYTSEQMELIAEVYEWKGIEALCTSVTGYTQRDYIELLIVATPKWAKEVGAPRVTHAKQLDNAAEVYAAWAFGDVYGYIIETPDGEEDESCWGYYGSDLNKSGLIDAATESVDWSIEHKRKTHQEHVKTMIRNHVPLQVRAEATA